MEELKLIEGKFSPMEAKELLLNLISSKIQFHNDKNFSSEICTGEPEEGSLEKIISLRSARERMVILLEEARNNNLSIEIESSINIYFSHRGEAE